MARWVKMEQMKLILLDDITHNHIKYQWFLSGTEPEINIYDEQKYTWSNTNEEHYGPNPPEDS